MEIRAEVDLYRHTVRGGFDLAEAFISATPTSSKKIRWQNDRRLAIMPAQVAGRDRSLWLVDLSQSPALFREFAALRVEDPNAICRFADVYGCLGRPRYVVPSSGTHEPVMLPDEFVNRPLEAGLFDDFEGWEFPRIFTGEDCEDWRLQVSRLKSAVDLWDMIVARDARAVSRHLTYPPDLDSHDAEHVEEDDTAVYHSHPSGRGPATPGARPVSLTIGGVSGLDPVAIGTHVLAAWLDRRLGGDTDEGRVLHLEREGAAEHSPEQRAATRVPCEP